MKIETLKRMIPKGKIFSVTFTKRNGETRKMCCRTGVVQEIKGTGMAYNAAERGILTVFDMSKKNYRSIRSDSIQSIKIEGTTFKVS